MIKKSLLSFIVMASFFVAASPLQAVLKSLIITDNPSLAANPNLSFFVDILNPGEGKVDFVFHNESKSQSSIMQIHFDDSDLLGLAQIINGPGTSFSAEHGKHNGWNCKKGKDFDAADIFSTKGNSSKKGVNPGELVEITFNLNPGASFDDVIAAINGGDLRINTSIADIEAGCKNANTSVVAVTVPEPATLALLGIGALALVRTGSKRE